MNEAEGLFNAQPPPPPLPSVSTIPEESDFLYCSISCWTKRTLNSSRLALCLVSGVSWRTGISSDVAAPVALAIGRAWLAILLSCCCFFFLIPFQCLQVSQKKETQSFQREMSFSVPSFLGTIILSMGSFLQVTFFIDKIKQTRNYHVRKQLRHNVKSNYKASTQNHPSPNNNPPSIIFSLLHNTNTTNNIALLELEIKYVF